MCLLVWIFQKQPYKVRLFLPHFLDSLKLDTTKLLILAKAIAERWSHSMEIFHEFLNPTILSLHLAPYLVEERREFSRVDSDFKKVSKRQVHYRIESWKITNIYKSSNCMQNYLTQNTLFPIYTVSYYYIITFMLYPPFVGWVKRRATEVQPIQR